MPIYEYQCTSCGKEFELLLRGSSPRPQCPGCSSSELHKKLSAFATVSSSASSHAELPAGCQGCGHAGMPGACEFA